jgi:multidrug resistance protein, MATE family
MDRAAFRLELAAAARLAAPVAATQLGMMLMGTVDTMMLGHLSAPALAAGSLGNVLAACALMFGSGVLWGLDPLVSQAHGAGDAAAVSAHLQRGVVMAAAVTLPFILALLDIEPLLRATGQPPGVSRDAADYARGLLGGALPWFLFIVVR